MYVRRRTDEGAGGNERDRQAGSCEPGNLLFCSGWTGFREKQFRRESISKGICHAQIPFLNCKKIAFAGK